MVSVEKYRGFLTKVKKEWVIVSTGVNGKFVGLLTTWNPRNSKFLAYEFSMGIYFSEKIIVALGKVNLINCYGPFYNIKFFWT